MRAKITGRLSAVMAAILSAAVASPALAQNTAAAAVDPMIAKIREEGMQRSQVMQTLSLLTDVNGPRLMGSPGLKRANEWTRDQLTKWGLENARLEPWAWGGRGWKVNSFKIQAVEPMQMSIIAYPKAWSMGLEKPVVANVVWLDARTEADLEKYKGKLKGAIVLFGGTRAVGPKFEPDAVRLTDAEVERRAATGVGGSTRPPANPPEGRGGARGRGDGAGAGRGGEGGAGRGGATTAEASGRGAEGPARGGEGPGRGAGGRGAGGGGPQLARGRVISFLMEEGAVMELSMTTGNEFATLVGFQQTTLPTPAAGAGGGGGGAGGGGSPFAPNAPASLPQLTVSIEHYNRLVRIAQAGVPMKIDVDLQVEFTPAVDNSYNTIAEIPGSDLKDEVVMLGGHMDSFHMATGATDNGTGVAVCMEAVRILKALNIQPRRTIRIGLWTGEELGLLGSRAYVRQTFGVNRNDLLRGGRGAGGGGGGGGEAAASAPSGRGGAGAASQPGGYTPAHEKFSVYFNTDSGGGKFRGASVIGDNPAAVAIVKKWIEPMKDLGIGFVSQAAAAGGGSDHASFSGVELPAINFVPDPIDYWAGTWHTSQDLYDHVYPEDVKISSVIMATCIYQAAMAPEKMPRRQ